MDIFTAFLQHKFHDRKAVNYTMREAGQSVSVAICTYNGERYIREQLDSIINQTHKVNEIVICDDGSTDGTVTIAKEVLREAGVCFRIVCNVHQLGVTKNFEKAISLCTGDIIFLSDQDDIWDFDKVSSYIKEFLQSSRCVLVYSDAKMLIDGHIADESLFAHIGFMQKKKKFEICYTEQLVRQRYSINGCLMAIRKSFFEKITPFYDSEAYHDCWIAFSAPFFGEIRYIPRTLSSYRIHPQSTTVENGDKYHQITKLGTARERRFYANYYFRLRKSLCEEILSRYKIVTPYNRSFKKAIQDFVMYRKIMESHMEASAALLSLRLVGCFFAGKYFFRIADRNAEAGFLAQVKMLISDIIFLYRNEWSKT